MSVVNAAALLFMTAFAVVAFVVVVTLFTGVDAASVQRKCRAHHGVAGVSSAWLWKDKTIVVCRDGTAWDGRP